MPDVSRELLELYESKGQKAYGLWDVTQAEHALQAAANAENALEPAAMIVACLLHDVGHMVHTLGENTLERRIDDRHEDLGAEWIADRFPPEVSEPVRLHVAAKRYLCAVEDHYKRLAGDSRKSLELQGGPMLKDEVETFVKEPFAQDAIRLRRYCDAAKSSGRQTKPLSHFMQYVDAIAAG